MTTLSSIYKYQYDITGVSAANLVVAESKTVLASNPSVFVPNEGLFFGDSVVITNGGTTLTLGVDYELEGMDPFQTAKTGKPVYGGIKRLTGAMIGTLSVTYQCLGGAEGVANSFIEALIDAINNATNNPTVNWADIIGKPTGFTPAAHRHYPSDLEDLDLLAQKFDDFVDAIVSVRFYKDSNHSLHNEILRLTALCGSLRTSINSIAAVSGALADIQALEDKINNFPKLLDSTVSISTGVATNVININKNDFTNIRYLITIASADGSKSAAHTLDVLKGDNDISPIIISSNIINGGVVDVNNPSEWLDQDIANSFRLSITPPEDVTIKIKTLYHIV